MGIHMQILIAALLGIKRNWHIFVGLLLGIICGLVFPQAQYPIPHKIFTIIGQIFINAIQMVVIPLVISAIVIGISSVGDNKQLAKFGKKMIFYYAVITFAAVAIGALLGIFVHPGNGAREFINPDIAAELQGVVSGMMADQQSHLAQILLNLIPKNPFHALSMGDMIPIIVFVLIFSIALSKIGEINRPVVSFFESIFAATMKVTDWIMYLAAPGIFALVASSISSFGVSIFHGVGKYFLAIALGTLIQFVIVYPFMLKVFSKVSVLKLYGAMTEAAMVAFGTASSSATLPLTITCCEKRGISSKICSFVLPLGATLNMDGTAMVQMIAALFLTQAYGIELSALAIVQIGFLVVVASSTCAGIPGAGLITIALVLNGIGLTPEQMVVGFSFLFALDRFTDMLRTTANVMSDAVVAAIIADNANEINYELFNNPEVQKDII